MARRPLGLVVGGLVVSQLLTLYIMPVVYVYLDRPQGAVLRWGRGRAVESVAAGVRAMESIEGGNGGGSG
jgi:hypothetical protein